MKAPRKIPRTFNLTRRQLDLLTEKAERLQITENELLRWILDWHFDECDKNGSRALRYLSALAQDVESARAA